MQNKLHYLFMLTILVTVLAGCGSKKEETVKKARYVKVMQLDTNKLGEQLQFNGQVKEKREVNVAFKVGGQVVDLLVDEGDYVKEGQVIAKIDKRDYKIRLQGAKAQYDQIEGEYTRYKELFEKNKLPANTLEKLEAGYLGAKSQYEAAENALHDTELKAPFSGYVYKRNIHKYENVGPGQPVISLLDVSQLEVHFSLSERQVAQSNDFKKITCDVTTAGVKGIEAEILSVNEKANGSDMYDVRLALSKEQVSQLRPGMSVKVNVEVSTQGKQQMVVPLESVFKEGEASYVWVYNRANSTVNKQQIQVNQLINNGYVAINSKLKGDEMIVVAGVHSLQDNQEVRVLENNKL
ncbi:efflux RND transporter periplasmic adaptor subunit [Carboxylicivirga caseinilyticus]|uniref:efflux RND transporter periplasmic adaptor subunit n=1 Tax=Carboxylicivirga caseinilyticus TaxID=3417572 RepID=UPI003D326A70|nr:efflux RND transporter periplasmic adaptor subunit [Marinilabiliaceae bacterium A049]